MAVAAPASAASNLAPRRVRIGLVLGFWLAGLGIFTFRHLLATRLYFESETSHQWTELSEGARLWLLAVPIACCCCALAMQICWLRNWGRFLSWAVSVIFVPPMLLITWVIVDIGPHRLDAVAANGHQYVLAVGGYGFDDALILYEVGDATGLSWREVDFLFDYPGNDALTGDEHLVLSADGRWLLFARGGSWRDCFRLADGHADRIDIGLPGAAHPLDLAAALRLRSARIAALTGLRP